MLIDERPRQHPEGLQSARPSQVLHTALAVE
jgi:hypothetical protein